MVQSVVARVSSFLVEGLVLLRGDVVNVSFRDASRVSVLRTRSLVSLTSDLNDSTHGSSSTRARLLDRLGYVTVLSIRNTGEFAHANGHGNLTKGRTVRVGCGYLCLLRVMVGRA